MAKRITDLEEELFVSLHDLVFIDVQYLEKFIYVHEDGKPYSKYWISKQMRAMEAEGYIKSFPVAKAAVQGRDRLVYTLDSKGVLEVKEILGEADWDTRWTQRTPTYVFHSLRMSHIQAAYASQKDNQFTFKEFFSERRAFRNYGEITKDKEGKKKQSSTTVIRPDGAFTLEREINGQKVKFLFFVELERSRQRVDVTLNKIRRYNEYVRKRSFENDESFGEGVRVVRVLFVSNNDTERNKIMENSHKADSREIEKIGGSLLFGTYEDVIADPFGQIWKSKDSLDSSKLYSLYQRVK